MKDIKFQVYLFILIFLAGCAGNDVEENKRAKKDGQTAMNEKVDEERPVILFFGNSITYGYGIDPEYAFSSLIQERLDSLGYDYMVINAGLSGETTASGNSRISWVLKTIPDVFVLELGANDGLRGIDAAETSKNLKSIIGKVREVNPDVEILLAGMEVPPSMGEDYASSMRKIYPEISKSENVSLIPFILAGVAGEPELNIEDGIHPTEEGHRIVANTVWKYLKPLLKNK
ncbi:MAG: arylesterase [Cyclobacteriaceae bacterium]